MESSLDRQSWVYERSADGSARFVLGTVGLNPLICFGINPSTAAPTALDPTVRRVSRFAAHNGYDSWTMLNVYPQIATDPRDLDHEHREALRSENEVHIATALGDQPHTLLAGWGDLIGSRPYLSSLLRPIVQLTADAGCGWVSLGLPTKLGNPRHPLYVRHDAPLQEFDMERYLGEL